LFVFATERRNEAGTATELDQMMITLLKIVMLFGVTSGNRRILGWDSLASNIFHHQFQCRRIDIVERLEIASRYCGWRSLAVVEHYAKNQASEMLVRLGDYLVFLSL
jgi:hypothetical protein